MSPNDSVCAPAHPLLVSAAIQVSERLALLEAGQMLALLTRIEQQFITASNQRTRSQKRTSKDQHKDASEPDTRNTIRVAAEGAYRKAAVGLTSELMQFSADEDRVWADELIPRSHCRASTLAPVPATDVGDHTQTLFAEDRSQYAAPLKGVRFKKMTGHGPTGRRPEHLQDLLKWQRRREDNLLFRAWVACMPRWLAVLCQTKRGGSLAHGSVGRKRRTTSHAPFK